MEHKPMNMPSGYWTKPLSEFHAVKLADRPIHIVLAFITGVIIIGVPMFFLFSLLD